MAAFIRITAFDKEDLEEGTFETETGQWSPLLPCSVTV